MFYIYIYAHMAIYVLIHPLHIHHYIKVSWMLQKQQMFTLVQLRKFWGATRASGLINRRNLFGSILSHSHIHGGAVSRSQCGKNGGKARSPCVHGSLIPPLLCKPGSPRHSYKQNTPTGQAVISFLVDTLLSEPT